MLISSVFRLPSSVYFLSIFYIVCMPKSYEYNMSRGDKLLALIRKVFHNHPEFRHDSLKHVARFAPFIPFFSGKPDLSQSLQRIVTFADHSNSLYFGCPIVLAAGANKTAKRIGDYANMGFGGISVGTATRNVREGNTHRPRIGFIEKERAIHNSMGLNNDGVEAIAARVDEQLIKAHKKGLCVGVSVAETPGLTDEEEKIKDILESFTIAYKVGDYIEINVSCPNTGESRLDLDTRFSERIFSEIMKLRSTFGVRKAVFAKLSPDLSESALRTLLDLLTKYGVNGVVIGNTFPTAKMSALSMDTTYESLKSLRKDGDKGGLSGRPLYENMYRNVAFVRQNYPDLKVMACGGIDHGYKIFDLLQLGVCAVQCYSVVAFRWMAAHEMREELLYALRANGFSSLRDFDAAMG